MPLDYIKVNSATTGWYIELQKSINKSKLHHIHTKTCSKYLKSYTCVLWGGIYTYRFLFEKSHHMWPVRREYVPCFSKIYMHFLPKIIWFNKIIYRYIWHMIHMYDFFWMFSNRSFYRNHGLELSALLFYQTWCRLRTSVNYPQFSKNPSCFWPYNYEQRNEVTQITVLLHLWEYMFCSSSLQATLGCNHVCCRWTCFVMREHAFVQLYLMVWSFLYGYYL